MKLQDNDIKFQLHNNNNNKNNHIKIKSIKINEFDEDGNGISYKD